MFERTAFHDMEKEPMQIVIIYGARAPFSCLKTENGL